MNPAFSWFKPSFSSQCVAGCFMAFTLLLTCPAWAGYVPPGRSSAPRTATTTTGRRGGCTGNETAALTALAPQSHVGQTASTRPTFGWYVPESPSLPIEFSLYTVGAAGGDRLIYKTELSSKTGMMTLALPETQPALEVGQRYRWQVVLLCDPNRPSSALVTDAEIEVVRFPENLQPDVMATLNLVERANRLAEAGLWYDAIASVLETTTNPETEASQIALLADLAEIEAAHHKDDRSTQLRQIIEQARRLETTR